MAFGISGSTSRSQMVGADVIVTYYTAAAEPMVVDYKLTAQAQVRLMSSRHIIVLQLNPWRLIINLLHRLR